MTSRIVRPLLAIGISLGLHGGLFALVQVVPPGATGGGSVIEARLMQVPPSPQAGSPVEALEALTPTPDVAGASLPPAETKAALPVAAAANPPPPPGQAVPDMAAPSDGEPATRATPAPELAISSGADLTYYRSRELDTPLRALREVLPEYPAEAHRLRQSGKVRLQLKLEADGQVSDVEILGADPPGVFDESARTAFRVARFAPPQKGGRPVRALVVIEVVYDWAGQAGGRGGASGAR
ncbi:MAG: energy transducer TonB [Gammaproteobacteria bacterium]